MAGRNRRNNFLVLNAGVAGLAACALLGMGDSLMAQTSATPAATAESAAQEQVYIAAVTADDVYVRSGPAESYYPFAKIGMGQFVKVVGEKYNCARVTTTGPAFAGMFGYIRYDKSDTGKLRIAPDGRSAVTLGRVDVLAPNMESKFKPADSWKALVKLEADQPLTILETIDADKELIQKVALPEGAQGWIAMSYLRRATPEEASQWLTKTAAATPAASNATKTAANTTSNTAPAGDSSKPGYTTPQTEDGVKLVEASNKQVMGSEGNTAGTTTDPNATQTPTDATAQNAQPTTPAHAVAAAPPREPTLEDLEAAFKLLQKEPIETAEVIPMRELYLALGRQNPGNAKITRYVTGRVDQLQIWADLQKKRLELEDVRARIKSEAGDTDAAWRKLEASAEYTAVGRVAASTIYDGESLPKLLRLQDAGTGRTLAYLKPDEKYELVNLIGNLVGIVGDKTYDETLRLNIIAPRRVDILTPKD